MKWNRIISVVLLLKFASGLNAQDSVRELNIEAQQSMFESIIEPLLDETTDETAAGVDQIYDDLEWLSANPINLNTAQIGDLEKLPFLNTSLITGFLNYRNRVGELFSVYELISVDGFTNEIIGNMAAFTVVAPLDKKVVSYFRNEMNLRYQRTIEKSKGFLPDGEEPPKYSGSPDKYYMRYKGSYGERFRWGVTAEKDPGEQFFNGDNTYGFDFYSAYFQYKGEKFIREVCLGDFQVKMGQGLIFWNGFGQRKSLDNVGVRMLGQGLAPYTSTDENNYLRGVAVAMQKHRFGATLFLSNKNIDGNVAEIDSLGNVIAVTSLQSTGYHRTSNEIDDENSTKIFTAGASLKFLISDNFSAGINGVCQQFGAKLMPEERLYNKFYFRGTRNCNFSADMHWVGNSMSAFGEFAISRSNGKAVVVGMEAVPARNMTMSLSYRNYARDYQSINGNAFAAGSSPSNEEGFYAACNMFPLKNIRVSGFIDVYKSHWLKYTSQSPVRGFDMNLQAEYSMSDNLTFCVRAKTGIVDERSSAQSTVKYDVPKKTQRFRCNLNWTVSKSVACRFRVETSHYEKEKLSENGVACFTDFLLRSSSDKFSLSARVAYFNTSSYNSRIYAYENDMPQCFFIPVFYDEGFRAYVQTKLKFGKAVVCYLKYGRTAYFGKDTIGSGDNEIQGNSRNEIKAQLKVKF